jgi:hypothetical protein
MSAVILHEGVTQFDLPGGLHACQFCCMRMLSQVKSHPAPGLQVSGILRRFSAWVQRHADNLTRQGVKDAQRFVSETGELRELPTLAAVFGQLGWHRSFRIAAQTGGTLADDYCIPPALLHLFHTKHSYWVMLFGTYATCVFRVDTGFAWYDSHQGLVLWFPSADVFLAVAIRHYSEDYVYYVYTLDVAPDPCAVAGFSNDGRTSDISVPSEPVPQQPVPRKPLLRAERAGGGATRFHSDWEPRTPAPDHAFGRRLSERSLARCERIRSQHNNSRG